MSLSTFLHSDFATKKKKIIKWWHRNDWSKAHSPSFTTRIKTEWYYHAHKDECIVIAGWLIKFYKTKESYMNWGDDINVYMMERMTGKKVIPSKMLLFRNLHHQYSCIGSILPSYMNSQTVVWGSGCMNFEQMVHKRQYPKKIAAVRGPLTREYLIQHGIECPEIYGDPALLLPRVYKPADKSKKYPLTIIPHHHDWDDIDALMDYIYKYLPDAHIINITNYDQWTDVIDEIVQSEVVFSSSLHGLIVSDAYGVPNMFTEFIYHHPKYDKYEDYYQSLDKLTHDTGRHTHTPVSGMDICHYINHLKTTYVLSRLDLEPLLESCPIRV